MTMVAKIKWYQYVDGDDALQLEHREGCKKSAACWEVTASHSTSSRPFVYKVLNNTFPFITFIIFVFKVSDNTFLFVINTTFTFIIPPLCLKFLDNTFPFILNTTLIIFVYEGSNNTFCLYHKHHFHFHYLASLFTKFQITLSSLL